MKRESPIVGVCLTFFEWNDTVLVSTKCFWSLEWKEQSSFSCSLARLCFIFFSSQTSWHFWIFFRERLYLRAYLSHRHIFFTTIATKFKSIFTQKKLLRQHCFLVEYFWFLDVWQRNLLVLRYGRISFKFLIASSSANRDYAVSLLLLKCYPLVMIGPKFR